MSRTTKVVSISNPIIYFYPELTSDKWKYAQWIVILHEFYFEFDTPKSKKALALTEFISYLPTGVVDPPLNDYFPNEHILTISLDNLGMVIYLFISTCQS